MFSVSARGNCWTGVTLVRPRVVAMCRYVSVTKAAAAGPGQCGPVKLFRQSSADWDQVCVWSHGHSNWSLQLTCVQECQPWPALPWSHWWQSIRCCPSNHRVNMTTSGVPMVMDTEPGHQWPKWYLIKPVTVLDCNKFSYLYCHCEQRVDGYIIACCIFNCCCWQSQDVFQWLSKQIFKASHCSKKVNHLFIIALFFRVGHLLFFLGNGILVKYKIQ